MKKNMITNKSSTTQKIKATGWFNKESKQWEWENVKWKTCNDGIFKSNRHYPNGYFWNHKKYKQHYAQKRFRNTSGVILLRPIQDKYIGSKDLNKYDVFVVQCYNFKFGFPKGTCNANESYINAAMREFKEETGTDIELLQENSFRLNMNTKKLNPHYHNKRTVFFLKFVPSNFDIHTFPEDDVEITAFGWINLNKLLQYDVSNLVKLTYKQIINLLNNNNNQLIN